MKTLLPYQQTAFDRAITFDRLALFLQMRLGKCIVSIRWALHFRPAKVLVVAPLTTLGGWADELREEGLDSVMLLGAPKKRIQLARESKADWHLVNIEGLRSLHSTEFEDLPYDVVIIDESTGIKNRCAQQEAACEMFSNVPYRAILSGEPTPEGIEDIFFQFLFLHGHFMGQTNFFEWRYEHFTKVDFDWVPKPGHLKLIKQFYISRSILLSRKEAGVFDAKKPTRVSVTLPQETRDKIDEVFQFMEYQEPDGTYIYTKYPIVAAIWALRLCGGFTPGCKRRINFAKEDALVRMLQGDLRGRPVVVWFNFNTELHAVKARLDSLGIEAVVITGESTPAERFVLIHRFQSLTSKPVVALVQVACARFGVNLSRADHEIYFSNSVKFELRNQSEDRLIHLTKTKPINVIDLVAEDSPDEDLVNALNMKKVEARALKRVFDAALARRILAAKGKPCVRSNSQTQRKDSVVGNSSPSPTPAPTTDVPASPARSTRSAVWVRVKSSTPIQKPSL